MSQQRQEDGGVKGDGFGTSARRPAAKVVPRRAQPQPQPQSRPQPKEEEEVGKSEGETSLPPKEAHRLPPRPNGGRAVQAFDIPRHAAGSSRVFSRIRAESRSRLNSGTGKTFEAYATIRCFVYALCAQRKVQLPGFDGSDRLQSGIQEPGEEKTEGLGLSETLPPPHNGAAGSTSAVAPPLAPAWNQPGS